MEEEEEVGKTNENLRELERDGALQRVLFCMQFFRPDPKIVAEKKRTIAEVHTHTHTQLQV